MQGNVYVSVNDRIQVEQKVVNLGQVATVYMENEKIKKQIEALLLMRFPVDAGGEVIKKEQRQIIAALYLVEKILESFPGLSVNLSGAQACVVEYMPPKKCPIYLQKLFEVGKVASVCILCFFGGSFSVMAYHNDIGLYRVFQGVYKLATGNESSGFTILEIAYSFGLMLGIILFYNHIGKRRITKDPTPIEVSLRSYEKEMDDAMCTSWQREGKMIDAK